MKYTFSILTLVFSLFSFSQNGGQGIKRPKLGIHDLKLGVNLVRPGRTLLGSGKDTYEGEAALGVNGWNYVFDFGTEKNERSGGYTYENKGSFFRLGVDRNFVQNPGKGNVLALGLRYARAGFEDQLTYSLDNGFGDQQIDLSNANLKARWFELNFTLRGKIVSQLYTGFTLRWKFSRKVSGEDTLQAFDIPGFGNTKRENATSFDYYVMWRIPLRKEK
ncbi:MAG: DUF6048 family protein [Cyclobacteriaceae bacterium]